MRVYTVRNTTGFDTYHDKVESVTAGPVVEYIADISDFTVVDEHDEGVGQHVPYHNGTIRPHYP